MRNEHELYRANPTFAQAVGKKTVQPNLKQKSLAAGTNNPAILIKLCSNFQPVTINQSILDSLTDNRTDRNSPVVKSFRTNNTGLLILSFENEANRDDALCRIRSKSTEGIFSSVFIPFKAYPFIVKLNNVDLNLFPTTPSDVLTKLKQNLWPPLWN